MPKPIFLTPETAASILVVSQRTITNLLTQDKLPGRKVGDRWRIERNAFETYIGRELTDDELAAHGGEAEA